MPRYSVDLTIGTLTMEVEAAGPDDAVGAAIDEWYDDAANILSTGTFSVLEVAPACTCSRTGSADRRGFRRGASLARPTTRSDGSE